jgi:hypothetical protein
MKPLYVTKHYSEPGLRDNYTSRVYIHNWYKWMEEPLITP